MNPPRRDTLQAHLDNLPQACGGGGVQLWLRDPVERVPRFVSVARVTRTADQARWHALVRAAVLKQDTSRWFGIFVFREVSK